jgi:hypothetical protein
MLEATSILSLFTHTLSNKKTSTFLLQSSAWGLCAGTRTELKKRHAQLDRAILDLKIQRDKLHQYQRRITLLTDRETAVARQLLAAGDRPRALLALRRKKYQETLLQKTDAQLEQLEQLTRNVEFALIQKDVVFGLQQGTRVLTEIHAEMGGIENVEKLMGETADAVAYQKVRSSLSTHTHTSPPFLSFHSLVHLLIFVSVPKYRR